MKQQRTIKKRVKKYDIAKWGYFVVIIGGILLVVLMGDYLIRNHEAIGHCIKEAINALAPMFSFSMWKHSLQVLGGVILLFILVPCILIVAYKASVRWTRKREEKKMEKVQKEEEKKKQEFAAMAQQIDMKQ